jgi:glutamine synthetase
MQRGREPDAPLNREADLSDAPTTLPTRLDDAIRMFRSGDILPAYLGEQFVQAYAAVRKGESDDYHGQVPDLDYEWYLRAI